MSPLGVVLGEVGVAPCTSSTVFEVGATSSDAEVRVEQSAMEALGGALGLWPPRARHALVKSGILPPTPHLNGIGTITPPSSHSALMPRAKRSGDLAPTLRS